MLCNGFTVYQRKSVDTFIGLLEMAVIGSSHYLKIEGKFCEIISCVEPMKTNRLPVAQCIVNKDLEIGHQFSDFEYKASVIIEKFDNALEFNKAEIALMNQQLDLQVAFNGDSAITAICFAHAENNFTVSTWHTYPEALIIVESKSAFSNYV